MSVGTCERIYVKACKKHTGTFIVKKHKKNHMSIYTFIVKACKKLYERIW